jgi:hypothetical protein
MRLSNARRLTIRKQVRVCFRLCNGMRCAVNEPGVNRAPELKAPRIDLENEFDAATQARIQVAGREELAKPPAMVPAGAVRDDEHEE